MDTQVGGVIQKDTSFQKISTRSMPELSMRLAPVYIPDAKGMSVVIPGVGTVGNVRASIKSASVGVRENTVPISKSTWVREKMVPISKPTGMREKTIPISKSTWVRENTIPVSKPTGMREKTIPISKSTWVREATVPISKPIVDGLSTVNKEFSPSNTRNNVPTNTWTKGSDGLWHEYAVGGYTGGQPTGNTSPNSPYPVSSRVSGTIIVGNLSPYDRVYKQPRRGFSQIRRAQGGRGGRMSTRNILSRMF